MSRKKHSRKPARTNLSVLAQLCNLIPGQLVPKLGRQCGVDAKARSFSPWSHVVALLYAPFTHSMSLNDVCDALRPRLCGPPLRGRTPLRNGIRNRWP